VNVPLRIVLIAGAVSFVALALAAALLGALPGDHAVRDWLLDVVSPPAVEVLGAVNHLGSWRLLLPATLLILLVSPRARRGWWIWVGLMLAAPGTEGLTKIIVARARPEEASMGFPSGHATAAAAFFGAVIYLAGRLPSTACFLVRVAAVLVIVLVGMARIVLRAHWPSDVVAGMLLGLAFACAAAMLDSRRVEPSR
jgi:undecaprenyl-diphosphatase